MKYVNIVFFLLVYELKSIEKWIRPINLFMYKETKGNERKGATEFKVSKRFYNFFKDILYSYSILKKTNNKQCYLSFIYSVSGPTDLAANHAHCQKKSKDFRGNIYNYLNQNSPIFLACWDGQFRECLKCPAGLIFKDGVNWKGEPYVYGHCGYPQSQDHNV